MIIIFLTSYAGNDVEKDTHEALRIGVFFIVLLGKNKQSQLIPSELKIDFSMLETEYSPFLFIPFNKN
ncbi:hypothetical protein B9475_007175 [Proteus mirabilis]|nr:hypothetical protein B9475_007175 [Proteus mirabilis]